MIVVLCAFVILKQQSLLTVEWIYCTSENKNRAYFIPRLRLFVLEECETFVRNSENKARWLY